MIDLSSVLYLSKIFFRRIDYQVRSIIFWFVTEETDGQNPKQRIEV